MQIHVYRKPVFLVLILQNQIFIIKNFKSYFLLINPITSCQQCVDHYKIVNNVCVSICGDGYKTAQEECDDSKYPTDMDGCSSQCKIQQGFLCTTDATFYTKCQYNKPVEIEIKYIKKTSDKNEVIIQTILKPSLLAFFNLNFSNSVLTSFPSYYTQYTYDPQTGELSIIVGYSQDIQDIVGKITFDPSGSTLFTSAAYNSVSIEMNPDNNEPAYYHSQSQYYLASITEAIAIAASAFGLSFFLIGMIYGKMIVVETLAVLQLGYIGLLGVYHLNPTLARLAYLYVSNGYNKPQSSNALENKQLPRQLKGIFLDSHFLLNYNLVAFFIFIPMIASLVFFIMSKILTNHQKRLITCAKRSIGEYTFTGIMLSSYLCCASLLVNFIYGINFKPRGRQYFGLVFGCIIFLIGIGYFFFLLAKPKWFGQYTNQFRQDYLIARKYYSILLVQRYLTPIILVALLSMKFQLVFPIVGVFFQLLLLIIRPYQNKGNNIRVLVNMLVTIFVLATYLFYDTADSQLTQKNGALIIPLLIAIILLLTVVFNGAFLLFYFFFKLKEFCNRKSVEKREQIHEKLNQLQIMSYRTNVSCQPQVKNQNMRQCFDNISSQPVNTIWNDYDNLKSTRVQNLNNFKKNVPKLNPKTDLTVENNKKEIDFMKITDKVLQFYDEL